MTIQFSDAFVESTDTALSSHTPETGTGWAYFGGADVLVVAATDIALDNSTNDGNRCQCTDDFGSRDMKVTGTFSCASDPGTTNIFHGPSGRSANSTSNGAVEFTYDYTAAGGSYNLGSDQTTDTSPDGSAIVMTLICNGNTCTGYADDVQQVQDTNITSTNQFFGMLLGNFTVSATAQPSVDDFTVDDDLTAPGGNATALVMHHLTKNIG